MTATPPRREPVFNVPPVVMAILIVLLAVQIARAGLSDGDDNWLVLALAFIPERYVASGHDWPGGTWAAWASPLTHMFVHGDWTHLLLNGASLLAFGSLVARRLGPWRFLALAVCSGLAGAAMFLVFNFGEPAPMIGASGAIAGMMAAALRLMFSAIDTAPAGMAGALVRQAPGAIALMDLGATIEDRRIRQATVLWLAVNMLGAFGLGTPAEAGAIAWEAHVGGYFAGLLGLGLFDPPQVAIALEAPAAPES